MTRLGRIGFEKRYENDQVPDQKFGQIKSAHAGPTPFDDRERLSISAFYFRFIPQKDADEQSLLHANPTRHSPADVAWMHKMLAHNYRTKLAHNHTTRPQEKTNKGLAGLRSVARSNKGYSSTYTTGRRD